MSTATAPAPEAPSANVDAGDNFVNFLRQATPQPTQKAASPQATTPTAASPTAKPVAAPDKPADTQQATKPAEPAKPTEEKKDEPKKDPKKINLDFTKREKAEPEQKVDAAADPALSDKDKNVAVLRKDRDALRAELENLRKQASQPPKEIAEKISKLEAERNELKQLVERVALEKSPEFNQKYQSQFNRLAALAKGNVPADIADQVYTMVKDGNFGPEFDSILESLEPSMQRRLESIRTSVEAKKLERDEELSKAGDYWSQHQQQLQRQQEAQMKEATELFEASWSTAADALEILQPIEGNEEHNQFIQSIKETAANIWSGNVENKAQLANVAIWGVVGPQYREALYAEMKQSSQLRQEIERLKGAQPNPAEPSAATGKPADMDADAAFMARFNGQT